MSDLKDTDHIDPEYGNIPPQLKRGYDTYVENILRGCTKEESALRAGVIPKNIEQWIRLAETDRYVIDKLEAGKKAQDINQLWTPIGAVLRLLQIADDHYERGGVRIAAIKELNMLFNFTTTDAFGNTKSNLDGRNTLADFERLAVAARPLDALTSGTKH